MKWHVKGRETGRAHVTKQCVLAHGRRQFDLRRDTTVGVALVNPTAPVRSSSCEVSVVLIFDTPRTLTCRSQKTCHPYLYTLGQVGGAMCRTSQL